MIRVLDGDQAGSTFLVGEDTVVGRSDGCDICLPDRRLSRRHARFYVENGRLIIEDLDSQHGSFVNGVRTVRGELSGGDIVDVGDSRLRVETSSEDEATPIQLVQNPIGLREEIVKEVRPHNRPNLGTRNFEILYDITQTVQHERDPSKMLASVVDKLLEAVRADRGYIATVGDTKQLIPKVVRYRDPAMAAFGATRRVAMSRTIAERVIEGKMGMISSDAATDDRFATTDTVLLSDIRSLMAVPMLVGERVLGLIEIEVFEPDVKLTESDLDLLSVVASTLAVALDNQSLARMREETIQQLKDAQAELLATQDRLVHAEQMAVVGRLASGIAHEVKNLLSPFMLADMLRHKYPEDEEVQETAQIMLEAQKHIYGLVDEIRIFAKGANADFDFQPQDVNTLVDGVLRFLKCDGKVKKTKITFVKEGEPLANIDASRIRQVLINLIRNAADAIDGNDGRVQIRVREADGRAIIDVMDNGSGVDPAVADRIFQPFFSTKGDKGLGLGLDISRKIVEAHEGTLTFKSATGKGTTFRLSIPALD